MAEARLTEKDLHNWRLIDTFQEAVEEVFDGAELHQTFENPNRMLGYRPYLSLFLFGLVNPVIESMRGLCAVSKLKRAQEEVCGRNVSLGAFSEAQAVLDPELLRKVFHKLVDKTKAGQKPDPRLAHLELIAQDGSLWRALPRMAWAEYGVGPDGEAKGVRLHLRFHIVEGKPVDGLITKGSFCERKALRQMCQAGQTSVGDRYYGEDYQLFRQIDGAKGFFVFRIKDTAVIHSEEELALTQEDQAAGVVRHAWVRLGATEKTRSIRLRLVEIRAGDKHLLLVTNLAVDKVPADLVGTIYRRRWDIELFFRWIKCILKCRRLFAESPRGVAIQIYLALIAALLLQDCTGRRPSKRVMELLQFYFMGWAQLEEVIRLIQGHLAPKKTQNCLTA